MSVAAHQRTAVLIRHDYQQVLWAHSRPQEQQYGESPLTLTSSSDQMAELSDLAIRGTDIVEYLVGSDEPSRVIPA
jgi:hypothetical protein